MEKMNKAQRVHYINAGAGAGKTTTLVNILRDILTEKDENGNYLCKPSEIILTTYTKAAAKEFREKTFQKLLEDREGQPAPLDVAKILDTATIGTVHSVAQQYIQRYWSLLHYSGQFNVMTDDDKKTYVNRSLKDIATDKDLEFFYDYANTFNVTIPFGKKRQGQIDHYFWKDYVKKIISKMRAYNIQPDDLDLFEKQSQDVVDRFLDAEFDQAKLDSLITDYLAFLKDKSTDVKRDGKISSIGQKALNKLASYDSFHIIPNPTAAEISNFINSECTKYSISDTVVNKKNIESSQKATNKYLNEFLNLIQTDRGKVKECITRIFRIAKDWFEQFDKYKRTNNLLDFDDLEVKFLTLLHNETVQKDIENSVKYLFVDEFQDSNPIQLEIFKKLSGLVKKSYWVGDRKQAIYGFRGSDSTLTTKLLEEFPKPVKGKDSDFIPNEAGCTSQLIDTSYRSVRSLVELANEVFERAFSFGDETIDNVSLNVKWENGEIEKPIQHWHCSSDEALAARVADILNGKVDTIPGVYDVSGDDRTFRKEIVPSDIAILSRTVDEVATMEEALRQKGIPVSSPETSIMDKAEVKLVISLLKYVTGINRKYAKAELSKLLENREVEGLLEDLVKGRYDSNLLFDEKDADSDSLKDKKDEKTLESTVITSSDIEKAPDEFFDDLDDKLQGLRGLNISALVKGVIAVMDIRNIVAKWGNTYIRQYNLDTLIDKSSDYERTTAHSSDTATVPGFIQYLEELELKPELDQSAEGVKVATYHKAKGLQWKIVILDSLCLDELNLTSFVKKNWFGVNLKDGFGNAKLQLIPSCGNVTDTMAEAVKSVSEKPSGKDDNGYFKIYRGKVEGEIKRLLYVGVTRACNYLITTSLKNAPLAWIKNIIGGKTPIPKALDNPESPDDKTDIDLWCSKQPVYYEKLTDTTSCYSAGKVKPVKLPAAQTDETTQPKTISPSNSKENYTANPVLVPEKDFSSPYIVHGDIRDDAAFGTCIHNYMAAHRWEGTSQIDTLKDHNIELANRTVRNHRMQKELHHAELLTQAADTLFSYLEITYGEGELLRECPFSYCRGNGQLVKGEIDLIWKNKDHCILIDYKNYSADKDFGQRMIFKDDKDNKFYIRKYFSQMGDYRSALSAYGLKVSQVFIFYAVLGCLVELKDLRVEPKE